MVSDAGFNVFVVVMFWSAVAIFALALGLMVMLLGVRIRAIARRRRISYLVRFWRAIFTGSRPNVPAKLRSGDRFTVLSLWADFQRVRRAGTGISQEYLRDVASVQHFDVAAARMLSKGDAGDQLVALTFMAYYAVPESLQHIRAALDSPYSEIALAAYRALLAIDPANMDAFAAAIALRDDFRPSSIEGALTEAGPAVISTPMIHAARSADPAGRARLLRYFTLLDPVMVHAALREFLTSSEDGAVIAAALRALTPRSMPEDRPVVRLFLRHPLAFVRIAAIGALVPICADEDRATLMELLSDRDSWVRYRAAQTLVECFTHEGTQGDLRREVADQYARDALTQVLAERSVVELRQFIADEVAEAAVPETEERATVTLRRPVGEMRGTA